MKIFLGSLLVATFLAGAAGAHPHLLASEPPDGATVAAPPIAISLTFSEAVRITALSIQLNGADAAQPIKGLPTESAVKQSVALPKLSAGTYTVTWRGIGADGHVASGRIRLTISPEH